MGERECGIEKMRGSGGVAESGGDDSTGGAVRLKEECADLIRRIGAFREFRL